MIEDAKTIYTTKKKLALVTATALRKLRPYFQSITVYVLSSHPMINLAQS